MNTGISGYVDNLTVSSPGAVGMSGTAACVNGTLVLNNKAEKSMNQQAKVAVFKVTRNEEGMITATKNIAEYWIEKKPGISIDYAVAKLMKEDLSPEEIIIKEIFTVIL